MRIVELHGHSDECSGLYVLDDGTHIHWSEGRCSEIDVIRPDGHRERHPVWKPSPPPLPSCRRIRPETRMQARMKMIQRMASNMGSSYLPRRTSAWKDCGSSDAPPTSAPSTSGQAIRSATFDGFTEPPYWMMRASATSAL